MSPRYEPLDRERDEVTERPGSYWGLVALAVAALLGLLMLASAGGSHDCDRIADNHARLACFDAAASAPPAKGAAIPRF
jgi:hypothetical protein